MRNDAKQLSDFLASYAEHVKEVLQPTQLEMRELFGPWTNP